MAQVILTTIGSAVGGPIGGAIGSIIGATIDRSVIASLAPARPLGPRPDSLPIQSTAEGSPMAAAIRRVHVGSRLDQCQRRVDAPTGDRRVERRVVDAVGRSRVHVGAAFEEQRRDRHVAEKRREVERGPAVVR